MLRKERSEQVEIVLEVDLFEWVQVFAQEGQGVHLLSVVASPASVAIASWVVCIEQSAGARVHVSSALCKQERMALGIVVACVAAEALRFVSPLLKFDTCWCIANTLVTSILRSNGNPVVAGPSSIAIGSWIVGVVECTCTGIHVSVTLSEQERLATGVGIALGLAPVTGLVSPLAK